MTAAQIASLCSAAAGFLTAVAAVLHSVGTRRQLVAHRESMEGLGVRSAPPGPPAGSSGR